MNQFVSILSLRIATYNIRNTQDRYSERQDYLKQTIQDVRADIIGLQEVAFGLGGQLDYLIEEEYDSYLAPTELKYHLYGRDPEARLDGNVLLSRKFMDCSKQVGQFKNQIDQQPLNIEHKSSKNSINDQSINKCSGKYYDRQHSFTSYNRGCSYKVTTTLEQYVSFISVIFDWIKEDLDMEDIIIMGDFNFMPNSLEYQVMLEKGFKSSYKIIHDKEPVLTFPTGITGPYMDTDPDGTFDYIWYKGDHLTPRSSTTFGEKKLEDHVDIYASDHLGIVTDFIFS